jgi:hypothetical protein
MRADDTSPTWSPRGRYRYWDVWVSTANSPMMRAAQRRASDVWTARAHRLLSPRGYPVRVGPLIDGCEALDFAFARGFQRRARIRRKLQHRGGLSDAKPCQQHHLSTRKFQCIVVFVGAV